MKKKNLYRELSVDFALTVYGDDVDSISKIDVEHLLHSKPEFREAAWRFFLASCDSRKTATRSCEFPSCLSFL